MYNRFPSSVAVTPVLGSKSHIFAAVIIELSSIKLSELFSIPSRFLLAFGTFIPFLCERKSRIHNAGLRLKVVVTAAGFVLSSNLGS